MSFLNLNRFASSGPTFDFIYCRDFFLLLLESAMDRDRFMSPVEAKDFGLIDVVLDHPPLPTDKPAEE